MIHKINLGQHPYGSFAHRINMAGELECFRIHEVYVGGRNRKNDAIGFGNILRNKVPRLFLDVGWLVTDWNLQVMVNRDHRN